MTDCVAESDGNLASVCRRPAVEVAGSVLAGGCEGQLGHASPGLRGRQRPWAFSGLCKEHVTPGLRCHMPPCAPVYLSPLRARLWIEGPCRFKML